MDKINLLEIEVDKLFQTSSINEIDELQKKIQYEIERKREDLRAMVGEKYRDLIQAADTIKEMKTTSLNIEHKIKKLNEEFEKINDKTAVGFRIEKPVGNTQNFKPLRAAGAQTKLLMDLPDEIWLCLDNEDYFKGTQLYIFARHVYAGLQLTTFSKSFTPLKAIISMQWNVLARLKGAIEKACYEKLQDVDLNEKVATSCLLSLYLLESPTMVELLKTFIKLHSDKSLEATLKYSLSEDSTKGGSLKDEVESRVTNSVRVVLKTIELVHVCFVESNGGKIVENLNALYSPESPPLVKLIDWQDEGHLPKSITSYRLSSKEPLSPLSRSDVAESVNNWLVWVKEFIRDRMSSLLSNIANVSSVHKIMSKAVTIETPKDWERTCFQLSIKETDIWLSYFQPLFTERIKQIIDAKMKKSNEMFEKQMVDAMKRVSEENVVETEADLNWFVWKDIIGETVIETRGQVIETMNSLMKGMWLQDHGISPNLLSIYQSLDSELAKLLQDLSPYTTKIQSESYADEEEGDALRDRKEIEDYLRSSAGLFVKRMLSFIKEDCFNDPTLQKTELQRKTVAIFSARFCQSLVPLVPNLRACIVPNDDGAKYWDEMRAQLRDCRNHCWLKWVDIALVDVARFTSVLPKEFTIEANVEYLLMQWDVIKIHQKDEQGADLESTIKIPSGPSLKLQQYLYQTTRVLNEVVPVTLPKCIHTKFTERLVDILLAHYDKVIRENETDINQKCALQLLVDVRHFSVMLITRDNKSGMEMSQGICERLRQKIDPFDYDVFYPHLQTNVKRSVQRVQTLFGSLITNTDHLSTVLGAKPILSGGTADKAPNLITMCSQDGSGQWFTLLPITAPVTVLKKLDRGRKKPSPSSASPSKPLKSDISELMTSSLPINLAQARSGAAAFFGSMTSDWFSGS